MTSSWPSGYGRSAVAEERCVLLNVVGPLVRDSVIFKDRADRTLGLTRAAGDALYRVDVELNLVAVLRLERLFTPFAAHSPQLLQRSRSVDAVDGADVYARSVTDAFTGLSDDIDHGDLLDRAGEEGPGRTRPRRAGLARGRSHKQTRGTPAHPISDK